MKAWKSNRYLKVFVIICSVFLAVLTLFLTVATVAMVELGVYELKKEQVQERIFDQNSYIYSVMALANMDKKQDFLLDTHFRYGIVKAEDINKVDLSDPLVYEDYNFTKMPSKDAIVSGQLKEYDWNLPKNGQIHYNWSEHLFGYGYVSVYSNAEVYGATKEAEDMNTYHVVYQVLDLNEVVLDSSTGSDLYQQAVKLSDLMDRYKYVMIIADVLSVILWLGTIFMWLSMCGHKKNKEGICHGKLFKIPLDVLTCVMGIAAFILMGITVNIGSIDALSTGAVIGETVLYTAGYLMALLWIRELAIRIKLGKWWQNTWIYVFLRWFIKKVRSLQEIFRENTAMMIKAAVIMGGILFFEFWTIVTVDVISSEVCFWFIEKIVICTLIIKVLAQLNELQRAGQQLSEGDFQMKVDTSKMYWECKKHGEYLNSISDGMSTAVEKRMQSERLKTALITNVSHDIKTPLTSIISYVDLLEKEELDNEKSKEYIEVLTRQTARLKKLIDDLMEASKASTGNVEVDMCSIELGVFLMQTIGEFEEKFQKSNLELILHKPEHGVRVQADGRHLWRVTDNLLNNICKYAQPGTRVYVELKEDPASIVFKNISKYQLDIPGEEFIERFTRGDSSRHTEGSGLGLSIAQSLMEVMGGELVVAVDGDLFKATVAFCEK